VGDISIGNDILREHYLRMSNTKFFTPECGSVIKILKIMELNAPNCAQ
jgi:hypothetical protein